MIDEQRLREILGRRASRIAATPLGDTTAVARRGRRRQLLTGTLGVLVAVGLAVGAFSGIEALEPSQGVPMTNVPSPTVVPSPSVIPSPSDKASPRSPQVIPAANDSYIVEIHFLLERGSGTKERLRVASSGR